MKSPSTNCPNCNSIQSFAPKYRQQEDQLVEVYSACTMCREEIHVDVITQAEMRRRLRRRPRRRSRI